MILTINLNFKERIFKRNNNRLTKNKDGPAKFVR